MTSAATVDPLLGSIARSFVVDPERRVVESNAPELAVGDVLTPASWLGDAALAAIDAASRTQGAQKRAARDGAQGTHWLLQASVVASDPWRARVVAVDATVAVLADREAVLTRVVHSMRNVSFAVQSVLEAIELDHPTGAELDEYLSHLKDPADRLAHTMDRLAACLVAPQPSLERVDMSVVVDRAVERVAPARRPARLVVPAAPLPVSADVELLSEAIAAMLESGDPRAGPTLEVDGVDVGGRSFVRARVERAASAAGDGAISELWDLVAGRAFEVAIRLAVSRAVVIAHGGEVFAASAGPGRVHLGLKLPLFTDAITRH